MVEIQPVGCKCYMNFFYNVLYSMHSLQTQCDETNSVKFTDLLNYIEEHYEFSGDISAQVRQALKKAERSRFVMEIERNRYMALCPAAAIHRATAENLDAEIERVQNIFVRKKLQSKRNKGSSCKNQGGKCQKKYCTRSNKCPKNPPQKQDSLESLKRRILAKRRNPECNCNQNDSSESVNCN